MLVLREISFSQPFATVRTSRPGVSSFGYDGCMRPTTELLCAPYQTNCRRGDKIVVVIRRKGHSPQKLPATGSLSCAEGHDTQKSVTTLDRRTCHRWLVVVHTFFFIQTEFIRYPSANLNQIYFATFVRINKKDESNKM